MSLTYRPTRDSDLGDCLRILSEGSAPAVGEQEALLAFWKQLLRSKVALSRVVEDRALPFGRRILGFTFSVFVSDAFKEESKVAIGPDLERTIRVRWQNGRRAFLNRREIALHSAGGGLNLLVVAQAIAPTVAAEVGLRVRARLLEAFIECHGGYGIKEILQEVVGPEEKAGALGLGWKVLRDGAADSGGRALMGFHRDDCRFPNPLWGVFHPPEPRFRFSDVEKDLLEAALLSGTDEEISRSLDLSIWTIKKRWQRVYEKVDRVIPDLLQPIGEGEAPPLAASPSGQRRRHLLDYLRQAPHEIRPALPPGPARAASRR